MTNLIFFIFILKCLTTTLVLFFIGNILGKIPMLLYGTENLFGGNPISGLFTNLSPIIFIINYIWILIDEMNTSYEIGNKKNHFS